MPPGRGVDRLVNLVSEDGGPVVVKASVGFEVVAGARNIDLMLALLVPVRHG